MSLSVTIEGFDQARQVLDALPDKFQVQTIRKVFRKAAKPLIDDAKARLLAHDPNFSKLADAIGFIPVRTKDPIVLVGIRAKGKYKETGYIGHWIEYGVSGIKTKTSKRLSKPEDESYRFWVARVSKGGRYRNDIPPQPFMRPAIDSKRGTMEGTVLVEMENHLYSETQKALARHRKRSSSASYAKAKERI